MTLQEGQPAVPICLHRPQVAQWLSTRVPPFAIHAAALGHRVAVHSCSFTPALPEPSFPKPQRHKELIGPETTWGNS